MKENKTIEAAPLLLLMALILCGCQAAHIPQSHAATPQCLVFSYVEDGGMSAEPLPPQPTTSKPPSETQLELAVDGAQLQVVLKDGTAYVYQEGAQVWRSDTSWDVQEMLLADPDNDGSREVAFVLWKPFALRPRFLYENFHFQPPFEEGSLRNHLFLYGWREGEWRPLWCSSPLADPIRELAVGDVDADRAEELVVLEGSYDDPVDAAAYHATLWRWNGWGFTLYWRSPPGRYRNLILQDVTGDEAPDIVLQDEL